MRKKSRRKARPFDLTGDLLGPLYKAGAKGKTEGTFSRKKRMGTAEVVAEALERGWIREEEKRKKTYYCITPMGEMYYLESLSPSEKMSVIKKQREAVSRDLAKWKKEVDKLCEASQLAGLPKGLRNLLDEIGETAEAARREIEGQLDRCGRWRELVEVAEGYLEDLKVCEEKVVQKWRKEKEKVDEKGGQLMKKLSQIEDRLARLEGGKVERDKEEEPTVNSREVAHQLERAFSDLLDERPLSTMVTLPDLYRRADTTMEVEEYKDLLQNLRKDRVVDLHPVNHPGELEEEFVIPSIRGRVYYISWRK